jgi:hypothetical protein
MQEIIKAEFCLKALDGGNRRVAEIPIKKIRE